MVRLNLLPLDSVRYQQQAARVGDRRDAGGKWEKPEVEGKIKDEQEEKRT